MYGMNVMWYEESTFNIEGTVQRHISLSLVIAYSSFVPPPHLRTPTVSSLHIPNVAIIIIDQIIKHH